MPRVAQQISIPHNEGSDEPAAGLAAQQGGASNALPQRRSGAALLQSSAEASAAAGPPRSRVGSSSRSAGWQGQARE